MSKVVKVGSGFIPPFDFVGGVEYPNGHIAYYKEGTFHRVDGPAIIWVGESYSPCYYLEGRRYEPAEYRKYLYKCRLIAWKEALDD